ncbi:MAG: LysR family transcriptional regulator [Burkholderiales bacterium]|nr:LysR family transcriptional regulator [Burkholderiales bacterium]
MNYAGWKLFLDALELGSLSKVALAYGTSQPHVSRRLSELERACGGRLFQRTGRGVVPTTFGERVAPKVRAWLASTEALADDIHATAGKPIGRVRLGILPSAAHPLVSTLCRRVQARYPLVQLSVREGQGAQLETWLDDGSVDLAILFRHSETPRGGDVYLLETPTYLVSAEADPLTAKASVPFAKLRDLPLVQFCRPNSWRDRLDQIARARGMTLNVALEADSLALQTRMVAGGGVYALLGAYAVSAAAKELRIRAARVVEPTIKRHVALAMARHGELTLAGRTVMLEVQEIAKAGAAAKAAA